MSENKRPYLSAEDKVSAVKRHLLAQIPVSEICDELGVDPNRFYEWQSQLFQNGASALRPDKKFKKLESKVDQLESKLLRKDQVVSELIEELMDSKKKEWGELMKGWTEPDIRDEVVDFIAFKKSQTGLSEAHLLKLLSFERKKFYTWKQAYDRPWLYSCNPNSVNPVIQTV